MTKGRSSKGSKRTRLPTIGFVAVCLTLVGSITFFAWGFSQPELDRVWWLHHQLKTGEIPSLDASDRSLLVRNMRRHPNLASALLGGERFGVISARSWQGWLEVPGATLVRTADATECDRIELDIQTQQQHLPFAIELSTQDWSELVEVKTSGPRGVVLPPTRGQAQLITVTLGEHQSAPDQRGIGIRLTTVCRDQGVSDAPAGEATP